MNLTDQFSWSVHRDYSRVTKSSLNLTLFDMGGGGGIMDPKIFLTTVLKPLEGES